VAEMKRMPVLRSGDTTRQQAQKDRQRLFFII